MKKFLTLMLGVAVIGLAGCGYTTSSALPERMTTIYVDQFKNDINYTQSGERNVYFPLLEVKVRNKVIDRFLFDGHLRIASEDTADLVLRGSLVEYRRNALRYTDSDDVEEYRVQVIMKLELTDTMLNEVMWESPRFVGEATYFITGAQAESEDSAVEAATVDLARRIVEKTIENW